MATAWAATASLAASGAVGGNFTSSGAIGAALNPSPALASGVTQRSVSTASLAANAAISAARATQQYALLQQSTFAQQNDTITVLANLVAVTCASRASQKYQAIELIGQVVEIATMLLDEVFGLRPMPLQRPDNDQVAELIRAATVARSATTSLAPLPPLKH
jgi:hypothetical protein